MCDRAAQVGSERVAQVGEHARDDEQEESEESLTSEAPSFQSALSKDGMAWCTLMPYLGKCNV